MSRAQRQARRQERKEKRHERKQQNRQQRYDAKERRAANRQAARVQRQQIKTEGKLAESMLNTATDAYAIENGVDPSYVHNNNTTGENSGGGSGLLGGIGGVIGSIFGGKKNNNTENETISSPNSPLTPPSLVEGGLTKEAGIMETKVFGIPVIFLALLGAGIAFFMSKNKKHAFTRKS